MADKLDSKEIGRHRCYGKYRGVVTDNNDPEGRGRIKVRIPNVQGDEVESVWASPCFGLGQFAVPSLGDEVWVDFESGDINLPIVTGFLFSDEDSPPHKADKLDSKEVITVEELAVSNMYAQEALVNLLEQKGILTKKEVLEEIQRLRVAASIK